MTTSTLPCLALAGPTASGKTAAALALAAHLAPQRRMERSGLVLGIRKKRRAATQVTIDLDRRRSPPFCDESCKPASERLGQAEDRLVVEQVEQERTHGFERIRPAQIK